MVEKEQSHGIITDSGNWFTKYEKKKGNYLSLVQVSNRIIVYRNRRIKLLL
jgi:hypothetical protein